MRDATCRREKSQVTFDGEIRPRVERRGFDLTLPNGLHDGQTRIPSLLRRPGLFVRGRSAAEILPGELVLLLGQFQRIGLLRSASSWDCRAATCSFSASTSVLPQEGAGV